MSYSRSMPIFERSKTAISRNNFSTPVQHLLERKVIREGRDFLDYGCGKGDDVARLQELSYKAEGWDPVFRPDTQLVEADIVNLGFVLNVIEDESERKGVLKKAWKLCRGALMVSTISTYDRPSASLTPYADGYLTGTGTFQKYYEPGKLKEYVDNVLEMDSMPVSPTQVICFRNEEYEQEYLAASSMGAILRKTYPAPSHPLRKSRLSQCIRQFQDNNPEDWEDIVETCINFAMVPPEHILAPHESLLQCGVKSQDILQVVLEIYGNDWWKNTVTAFRDRILVELGLAFFRGKPKPSHYGDLERAAIRSHFGSFSAAFEKAKQTLFSIGNPVVIEKLCAETLCGVEDEQALYIHNSCLPFLHPVLQTYIAVGRLFYGDLSDINIFKIHKKSGKLTLLIYDSFEESEEPILHLRVKIDYRMHKINYYNHKRDRQRLLNKDLYMIHTIK